MTPAPAMVATSAAPRQYASPRWNHGPTAVASIPAATPSAAWDNSSVPGTTPDARVTHAGKPTMK
ncbi:hypothetical protein L602_005500000120 [Cupriavidus gilardii J11]|uniref:Uncharacterized protein n=1 Tax=Cupriavidus gilardii J11 TaxID=936133 RepID=A0A562B451_9BURK|nr:hypothetical protein L602_005500000120 [Cupriavidus gilardii J11]